MDPSAADATDWAEPEEEEENASTGGPHHECGEREEDDEEDSGGGGSGEDDDDATATASPGATSTDSIILPPDPMSARLAILLRKKKLILVLDLDHTLINSTMLRFLSPKEQANGITAHTRDDPTRELFRLNIHPVPMLTKLRPFVREFLEEASAMFEMHVNTLAKRDYAMAVAKVLDPDGVYFGDRIVSRAKSSQSQPHRKSLDAIVGSSESAPAAVIILDDKAQVWEGRSGNLIEMGRYIYFASEHRKLVRPHDAAAVTAEEESLSERGEDENHDEGALAAALRVLRRVHHEFFAASVCSGSFSDVRELMKQVRLEVLSGCTVAFTGVIRRAHRTWRRAEQLGATYAHDVGEEEVTHVVAGKPGTYDYEAQAQQHGKFLVNQKWIDAAYFRWIKPSEEDFPAAP